MKNKNYLSVFWQLIYKELRIFFTIFASKIIDLTIIISTNLLVFIYIMPYFGLMSNYATLLLVALCSLLGFFEVIPRTSQFVMDITGTKKISYLLTIPLPTYLTLISIPISWGLTSAIYTALVIPLGKLILASKFSLANFSFWRFLLSFCITHLMYGFFAFWLAGLIKDIKYITWIWSRVVNPLFMFGGYFYTWKALFSIAPVISYINIFNPVLLSIESLRSAALGSENFLPYWATTLAMCAYILLFATLGVRKIKKRLDCV